jgi:hypothetical protein
MRQTTRKWRTSGEKYKGEKFNIMERCTGLKPVPTKSKHGMEKDVAKALRTTLNWKGPGRDQIANFWLKQLTATHKHIAALFNKLIEEDQIPGWLTAGVTFLIKKNTENPQNYRRVTCLPTTYKLNTYIISRRLQKYMDDQNLKPKEQKGHCSGSKGCKEQLLFQKQYYKNVNARKKIAYGMD